MPRGQADRVRGEPPPRLLNDIIEKLAVPLVRRLGSRWIPLGSLGPLAGHEGSVFSDTYVV